MPRKPHVFGLNRIRPDSFALGVRCVFVQVCDLQLSASAWRSSTLRRAWICRSARKENAKFGGDQVCINSEAIVVSVCVDVQSVLLILCKFCQFVISLI